MSFFDEVSNLSLKSNVDKEKRNQQRYEKAEQLAFDLITSTMKEKMISEAKAGHQSAIVHSWTFAKSRDDISSINVSRFNGVWIKDLCTKGTLLQRLTNFVNDGTKDESKKFRSFLKNLNGKLCIIVSWKKQQPKPTKQSKGNS